MLDEHSAVVGGRLYRKLLLNVHIAIWGNYVIAQAGSHLRILVPISY